MIGEDMNRQLFSGQWRAFLIKSRSNFLVFGIVLLSCLIGDAAIPISYATAASPKILTTIDPSQIALDDAVIMGNKNAPYRFIIFQDPDWFYGI